MMNKHVVSCCLGLLMGLLPIAATALPDKDHPLVGRYEGSELFGYTHTEFDEANLIIGPIVGEFKDDTHGWMHVEGEMDFYYYKLPAGRSTLEALRNYEASLKAKGFEVTYTCATSNGSCYVKDPNRRVNNGPAQFALANDPPPLNGVSARYFDYSARYLLAKLAGSQGMVYASITFSEGDRGNFVFVRVVTTKEMDSGKIEFVDAGQMQKALADSGRISLYGIQFDFDKDIVRSESRPTLEEIAKVLRADPELRLGIVGHTDAKGSDEYNVDLSKRRAANVAAMLTSDYAIATPRLAPSGAGASEPLASNDTEEGRAKNRRVELVRQ